MNITNVAHQHGRGQNAYGSLLFRAVNLRSIGCQIRDVLFNQKRRREI